MFKELQIHGQAFAMIGDLADFILAQLEANSQNLNLPRILTRHRSTSYRAASRRHRAAPIRFFVEEPTPEANDLAMSRLRTRERIVSSCFGL